MNPVEFIFGTLLVLILMALAVYFGRKQLQTLKRLREDLEQPAVDRAYLRGQAMRRLVCSGLMVILAALLVGSYFLEPEIREFTDKVQKNNTEVRTTVLHPEQRWFLQRFTLYWVFTLMVLFLFFFLAVVDIRATLRYGLDKHRQLRQDYRASLQEHVKRLRQERNGK